ncbi:SAM-dependent methyltransferase [Methanogenium organophilum]|uniref:SAM-dependent methyltransferase n=1 Tax=Methanogenium organophilum TaxID=2199 RepID=A0A9X9S705_METOG|nr:SAM-dependent methyltransferase [Methanogenium organophilum]WAI02015.1 SAM-dependent methyltransferase [Methanogenium organophilum]
MESGKPMEIQEFILKPIGAVHTDGNTFSIEVAEPFRPALQGLEAFSHILVVWWGTNADTRENRHETICTKPYTHGPETIGIFATRSPVRPNPIAVTVVPVLDIDHETGIITVAFIDADDNTPVLDIKPYLPCTERVRDVRVPEWSAHWPAWYEENASFDWAAEFTFRP